MSRTLPKAETLNDLFVTLSPKPLMSLQELDSYYVGDLRDVRGRDVVGELRVGLQRPAGAGDYKAFLSGRTGCGKSTEITRLAEEVASQYLVVRFEVTDQLDALNFQPFDVLLIIVDSVLEHLSQLDFPTGGRPDPRTAARVAAWFGEKTVTTEVGSQASLSLEAGVGASEESLLAKVISVFAKLKGEARFAASRKTEVVQTQLNRLDELVEAVNAFLVQTNAALDSLNGSRLLVVGEGFDKNRIPRKTVTDFFVTYANVLEQLRCSLILNLPLDLLFSPDSVRLAPFDRVVMVDVPVYRRLNPGWGPHESGRAGLARVLEERMDLRLFEEGQCERAIVASGGSLRTLFRIVVSAATKALVRKAERIGAADVTNALEELRIEFQGRLGEDPDEPETLTYEVKIGRLKEIYDDSNVAERRDLVLQSLVRTDSVLEYNGTQWFGLHPVVVEILKRQRLLNSDDQGGLI